MLPEPSGAHCSFMRTLRTGRSAASCKFLEKPFFMF